MQLDRANDDEALVRDIYETCQIAHVWNCHTIRDGMYFKCSRPPFTRQYLARKGVEAPDFARVDGVALHEPGLAERLRVYLADPAPLASCRYCLGTVGKFVPLRQLSRDEVASERVEARDPSAMVDRRMVAALRRTRRLERVARALLPTPAYELMRTWSAVVMPRREHVQRRSPDIV